MTEVYLLIIHGDVEPELRGPFPTPESRDKAALAHRRQDPEASDGLYMLDVTGGRPDVGDYSSGFFMENIDD